MEKTVYENERVRKIVQSIKQREGQMRQRQWSLRVNHCFSLAIPLLSWLTYRDYMTGTDHRIIHTE